MPVNRLKMKTCNTLVYYLNSVKHLLFCRKKQHAPIIKRQYKWWKYKYTTVLLGFSSLIDHLGLFTISICIYMLSVQHADTTDTVLKLPA